MSDQEPRVINPWRLFTGAMVPEWLMEQAEVSPQAKLAYARLARYAGERGYCWPTQEELARSLAMSDDQAYRAVKELLTLGLVDRERQGLGKPNVYRFLWHPWMDDSVRVYAEQESAASAEQEPRPVRTLTSYEKESNKESSSLPAVPRDSGARGCRIPEDFEVTPAMFEWAFSKGLGHLVERETERFINYWRGVPGARGRKVDWGATWRNWLLKAAEDQPRAHNRPMSKQQRNDDVIRSFVAKASRL